MKQVGTPQADNLILRALAQQQHRLFQPAMETVNLTIGMVVGVTHEQFDYAYFPVDAVISLIGTTSDGSGVEIAMVGREGYLGPPLLFGKPMNLYQAIVLHPGTAWRVPGAVLNEGLHASRSLCDCLLRYTGVRFGQLAQTAVCHRFHTLEQRVCRWLLGMHDRVRRGDIHLTHEWLAQLVGGRRPTINMITNGLKRAGAVEYRRGSLAILDRTELERRSCECYSVMAQEIREFARSLSVSSG